MIINIKMEWILAILLVFLISIAFNFRFLWKSHQFGVVDIQKLVSLEAQKLAALYPHGDVPFDELQGLTNKIRENIEDLTRNKNLILFSKGAVYSSNLVDYTEILMKDLKNEPSEQR